MPCEHPVCRYHVRLRCQACDYSVGFDAGTGDGEPSVGDILKNTEWRCPDHGGQMSVDRVSTTCDSCGIDV